ncbi:MAG TPA: hypothetical protein VK709_08635 [Candidatus Saccharimonadales bacterium]|jgi:hypothetical protein|nr:hypothetical protein [Candidatus Saccharimonadales bacterium]
MSLTIQPIQTPTAQTQPAAPPAKQPATQSAVPQDKVTISESSKQALTDNTKPAAGGDVDHDGDRH